MAVPKRRTSRTRKLKRRTHDSLKLLNSVECKNCGATIPAHRVCPDCKYYNKKKRL